MKTISDVLFICGFAAGLVGLSGCGVEGAEPLTDTENVAAESQALVLNLGDHVKQVVEYDIDKFEFWRSQGTQYTVHLKRVDGDPDLYTSDVPITDLNGAKCISQNLPPQNDWCIFEAATSGWNYIAVHAYEWPAEYDLWITSP